jgi:hypothetical protein
LLHGLNAAAARPARTRARGEVFPGALRSWSGVHSSHHSCGGPPGPTHTHTRTLTRTRAHNTHTHTHTRTHTHTYAHNTRALCASLGVSPGVVFSIWGGGPAAATSTQQEHWRVPYTRALPTGPAKAPRARAPLRQGKHTLRSPSAAGEARLRSTAAGGPPSTPTHPCNRAPGPGPRPASRETPL